MLQPRPASTPWSSSSPALRSVLPITVSNGSPFGRVAWMVLSASRQPPASAPTQRAFRQRRRCEAVWRDECSCQTPKKCVSVSSCLTPLVGHPQCSRALCAPAVQLIQGACTRWARNTFLRLHRNFRRHPNGSHLKDTLSKLYIWYGLAGTVRIARPPKKN